MAAGGTQWEAVEERGVVAGIAEQRDEDDTEYPDVRRARRIGSAFEERLTDAFKHAEDESDSHPPYSILPPKMTQPRYGSQESEDTIQIEKYFLAGDFVAGFGYGKSGEYRFSSIEI